MVWMRFICYLYTVLLLLRTMMMDIPYCKRITIFYLRYTWGKRSIYTSCSDNAAATEIKRGETWEKEKNAKYIYTLLLSHQSSNIFILFCSPLIGAHEEIDRYLSLSLSLSHTSLINYTRAWLSLPLRHRHSRCVVFDGESDNMWNLGSN
jgi:hypothetical protein